MIVHSLLSAVSTLASSYSLFL